MINLFAVNAESIECHIIYGAFDLYKPYEFLDSNGNFVGINIDILKGAAREAGCTYEIVSGPWSSMVEKLKDGNIDLMTLSPTDKTDQFAAYIPQSVVLYRYAFNRTGSDYIYSLGDLENKSVLVIKDSYSDNQLTRISEKYRFDIFRYPNHEKALKSLSAGTGDVFISTMVSAMNVLDDELDTIISTSGAPFLPSPYGFALNKNNKELYNKVSSAMDKLTKNGTYFKIINRWTVKSDNSEWIKYIMLFAGVAGLVVLSILAWNKSLHQKVQKRTMSLNNEIIERKQAQEALESNKNMYKNLSQLFQLVLDSLPDQIYLLDNEMRTAWSNVPAGNRETVFDINSIISIIEKGIRSSESFVIDEISEGEFSWRVEGVFLNQPKNPFMVIIYEITEKVRLRDEAMMAGKMAALGEMAAGVAHEINNPNALLIHNNEFLINQHRELFRRLSELKTEELNIGGFSLKEAEKEADEVFELLRTSTTRIKETVDSLKNFSRAISNTYEVIDMEVCVKEALQLTGYFIKQYTNSFTADIRTPIPRIYGNSTHIEQIVINLIHNACLALSDKTQKITLMLKQAEDRGYIKLEVKDEGCGMSEDVMEKAFNSFFTTRKNSGGTGLGLAITSRIVKEHKGFYSVDSTIGKGTSVAVYFPVYNSEAQS